MSTKKIKKESSNSNAEQGQESKKNTLVPVLHEIECTCDNIFEVFSVYEEVVNDGFKESWVRCPECSLYHNVIEINRSMISKRLPHGKKLINLPDDKIPEQISAILLVFYCIFPPFFCFFLPSFWLFVFLRKFFYFFLS